MNTGNFLIYYLSSYSKLKLFTNYFSLEKMKLKENLLEIKPIYSDVLCMVIGLGIQKLLQETSTQLQVLRWFSPGDYAYK